MEIVSDAVVPNEVPVKNQSAVLTDKFVPWYKNVKHALRDYTRVVADNEGREAQYAAVEGLSQGNPPYDQEEIDEQGLTMTNVNPLTFDSQLRSACQTYHAISTGVQRTFRIKLSTSEKGRNYEWGQIMADELQKILKKMKWFYHNNSLLREQLVKHGYSFVVYPDEDCCEFKTMQIDRARVGNNASSNIDEVKTLFVDNEWTYDELVRIYLDEKDDKGSPWHTDALGKWLLTQALQRRTEKPEERAAWNLTSVYEMEKAISRGDFSYNDIYDGIIKVVSVLRIENTGKVSHYMMRDIDDVHDFLYTAHEVYESMGTAVKLFTLTSGTKCIHDSKGIGWKAFPLAEQLVLATCSLFDLFRWVCTIFFNHGENGVNQNEELVLFQGGTSNLRGGKLESAANLGNNLNAAVEAHKYMTSLLDNNLEQQGARAGTTDKLEGSITDKQAMVKAHGEFPILKTDVEHFQTQYDDLGESFFARFLALKEDNKHFDLLKQFVKACVARGVPPAVFDHPERSQKKNRYTLPPLIEIRATRVAGDGSQVKEIAGQEIVSGYIGAATKKGQDNFFKDVLRTHVGEDGKDAYTEGMESADSSTDGASFATQENYGIRRQEMPLFSQDQDHMAHGTVHVALGMETLDALNNEQIDIIEAYQIVQMIVDHGTPHIQAAQGNPFTKGASEKLVQGFNTIAKQLPLLKKNAEEAARSRQEEQQRLQAKQQEQLSDATLKRESQQNNDQLKREDLDAKIKRADEASATRREVVMRQIPLKAGVDTVKAHYDGQAKVIKATAEASAAANKGA